MKKRQLYIFTGNARATEYGIGAYINQLITVLKDGDWEFHILYLYAQGDEVEVLEKDGYRQINIPKLKIQSKSTKQYYMRNVVFLLKEFIPETKGTEIIFQLNFMEDSYFINCLKQYFRCKIILVAHYTDWSFTLLGDIPRLKKLLQKSKKELKDPDEKTIVEDFNNNVKMIKRVDRLVCVAGHTQEVFHKVGAIPIEKMEVIHNALKDTYKPLSMREQSALRSKYCLDDTTRIILFAGRLDEVKGVAYLIRSFKKLLTTHPDSRLLIAGDGAFDKLLKEASDCWAKITFTGRLDRKKLYELYSIADIGVICSLHEEFGLIAIEMMMHALPVIVTKTGGLDEIVEDTVSGLKVPVRTVKGERQVDVKRIEEGMRFLLDHPSSAKAIGENGRKRFLEKFELSGFKEKMFNLYNTI